MGWDVKRNARCDTCDAVKEADGDTQRLRALGWHHFKGTTLGGRDCEAILCPRCARDEKKRERRDTGQYDGQFDIFGAVWDSSQPAAPAKRARTRKWAGD